MTHPRAGIRSVFLVAASICAVVSAVDPAFELLSNAETPQDVTKIHFPPGCTATNTRHPKTMFTLEPSLETDAGIVISTYPADLVTASRGDGGTLHLEWNTAVAGSASEGGVHVSFPADQLESVSAAADAHVQVLDGFTNIQNLKASSDAKLWATMTTSTASGIILSVSSDGEAKVLAPNASFSSVSVSSDGKLSLEAIAVAQLSASSDAYVELKGSVSGGIVDVSSDAEVFIEGNVTQGAKASSDGELTIYGWVDGYVRLSSDAQLRVGQGSFGASVEASSDAKVYAPTCSRAVTRSDAKCIVNDSISGSVDVSVDLQPSTLTGTDRCNQNWGFHFWSFGSWMPYVVLGAVVGTVAVTLLRRKQDHCSCHESKGNPKGKKGDPKYTEESPITEAVAHPIDDAMTPLHGREAIAYPVSSEKASGIVDTTTTVNVV